MAKIYRERELGDPGPEVIGGFKGTVSTSNVELWSGAGGYTFLTTPQPLRVQAGGNANDTAGGSGARSVVVEGISSTGEETREVLATAGASASAATSASFIHHNRSYVGGEGGDLKLGGGAHHGSNEGPIVIETTGGTIVGYLRATMGLGQSEQAIVATPHNLAAQLRAVHVTADANLIDLRLCSYRGVLVTSAPYPAVRVSRRWEGRTQVDEDYGEDGPVFPPLTDIWLDVVRGAGIDAAVSGSMIFQYKRPA